MTAPRIAAGVAGLAVAAALAAGCGEKSEPDLSNVPAPPQPQAPNPPQGLPQDVVGRWHGTLQQKGIKPFSITVSIVSATDPSRNAVHYGGQIDCSGTWRYVDANGPQVRFRETIDSGAGGKCKGSGDVTVSAVDGAMPKLRYRFGGEGIKSTGVLAHP